VQKAGSGAVGKGLLGDQFFRQIVMKIGDQHAGRLYIPVRRASPSGRLRSLKVSRE
jgi:hypothetical protein